MSRLRFYLELCGRGLWGWQRQSDSQESPEGRTAQFHLERALATVSQWPSRIPVQGSGRLDAGVHAEVYAVHSDVSAAWLERWGERQKLEKLRHGINGVLPEQMAVWDLAVDPHFHALDSLVSKTYRYEILLRRTKAVLDLDHAYWVPMDPQDWKRDQAQEAMSHFVGLHDFKAFCAASSSARSTQREVLESTMRIQDLGRGLGHKIDLFFKGRGFLKQMVRNMAGLIFEIGSGLKSPNEVKRLLSNPHLTRQDAGVCLPAHGLTLVELEYLEPWGILRRGDKLL